MAPLPDEVANQLRAVVAARGIERVMMQGRNGSEARVKATNARRGVMRCALLLVVGVVVVIAAPGTAAGERRDVVADTLTEAVGTGLARLDLNPRSQAVLGRQSTSPTCGDERDDIIREYVDRDLPEVPRCEHFSAGGNSAWFSFAELNSGDHRWAWIEAVLLNGLENTRRRYGNPIIVTSGYRCPERNARVGGVPGSLHQFGHAADVSARTVAEQTAIHAAATLSGVKKTLRYKRHVHLEW